MTEKQAIRWLEQPGIKATMDKYDPTTNEAIKFAIKSLKRNIPQSYQIKYKETVKVQLKEKEELVDVFTYHCPACGMELGDSDWDGIPDEEWEEYCGNCGQKIDWINEVEKPIFERIKTQKTKVAEIYGEKK